MKEIFLIFFYLSINPIICGSNSILLPNNKKIEGDNKKNLVIGVIHVYSWIKIKPFLISYIKANFTNCECVIFYRKIENDILNRIESLGIIAFEIPKQYDGMKINNVRYKIYEDYLSDKLDKYNMVLHADIRDTYFQKDVFKLYKNKTNFIGIALEDGNITNNVSSSWMQNQYCKEIYEELKNKSIICSGTIWGTVDKFLELAKNIWIEVEKKSPYNFSIHDQTAEAYLIYHKNMFNDCVVTSDIYSGPIMTVGLSNKNFSYDFEENLLNFQGDIAAVIHQYDRKPKIVEIVTKKFTNIPDKITLMDYINIIYIICIVIIAFIIIFFSRIIYLKQKELKEIIKKKEREKGYKKVKILK
jgi:hypothetical protein